MSVQFDLSNKFAGPGEQEFAIVFVDGVTQEQLGTFTKVTNPYAFNLTEFVPASGYLDLERLYDLASQVVEWKQELEGVPADSRVELVKEYPDTPLANRSDSEIITLKLISREPAKMSADGTKFVQRRPRWDREFVTSDSPAHTITVLSQPFDHEIEFTCWATDSRRADKRALWLERLFIQFSWVFLSEGADRWYYRRRGTDIVIRQNEHSYHQRPLRFFARLRELEAQYEPNIRRFQFNALSSD